MKTFSLAAASSVLLISSSSAFADHRPGREPFWGPDRHHHDHGRPFMMPISPLARVLPRVLVPSPAFVAPRREVVITQPTPAPTQVPVAPQPATNSKPNKPQPSSGQGNGGNKPPKPAR